MYVCIHVCKHVYGVATMSRLPQNIGLNCKRALWKKQYSAKKTYIFEEPANYSHPIRYKCVRSVSMWTYVYN